MVLLICLAFLVPPPGLRWETEPTPDQADCRTGKRHVSAATASRDAHRSLRWHAASPRRLAVTGEVSSDLLATSGAPELPASTVIDVEDPQLSHERAPASDGDGLPSDADEFKFRIFGSMLSSGRFSLRLRDRRRGLGRKTDTAEKDLWVLRVPPLQPKWTCNLSLMFFWEADRQLRRRYGAHALPTFPVSEVFVFANARVMSSLYIILQSMLQCDEAHLTRSLWRRCNVDAHAHDETRTPLEATPLPPSSGARPPLASWCVQLAHDMAAWTRDHISALNTLSSETLGNAWLNLGRQRDVFPLPSCTYELVADVTQTSGATAIAVAALGEAVVRALSLLAGYAVDYVPSTCTEAQRCILQRCVQKTYRLLNRFQRVHHPPVAAEALARIIGAPDGRIGSSVPLAAAKCDIHPNCGLVDVMPYLSQDARTIVSDPALLFAGAHKGLEQYPGVGGDNHGEYAKLILQELARGKCELYDHARGGGTIFCREKTGGRLRVLWHGSAVSAASATPPQPPHLASPACLLDLETTPDQPYYLSKRDGRVMYDQLLAPSAIRPYFAKPPLFINDLLRFSKWGLGELQQFWCGEGELTASTKVYPCSRVWSMGFSWSSFVCQSVMIAQNAEAGLDAQHLLAEDLDTPDDLSLVAAVATDDTMIFCSRGQADSVAAATRLDEVLGRNGIERHVEKDVDGVLNGVAIGIELEDGLRLAPETNKLLSWLKALCALLNNPKLSALQLSAFLGLPHWFGQLNRGIYSCFDEVYKATRNEPQHSISVLSQRALAELIIFGLLSPFLEALLDRPWAGHILATDAAPEFGFGLSIANATAREARAVGQLADKSGWYVRMRTDEGLNSKLKPRKGHCYRLQQSMRDFRTLISRRTRYAGHSGELEAQALVLLARWLARSPRHQAHRHAVLVDAKAALGAAGRGRTSSPTLKLAIRRLGAYALATDVLLKYTYVPSESNPADRPSRGIVARPKTRKTQRVRVLKVHVKPR